MFKANYCLLALLAMLVSLCSSESSSAKLTTAGLTSSGTKSTLVARNDQQGPQWWRRLIGRRQRRGGSRDDALNPEFCSIVPDDYGAGFLWSTEPLFVFINFQGNVRRIELYPSDSVEPQWQHELSTEEQQSRSLQVVRYTGPALEAGKVYYYSIRTTDNNDYPIAKEMMPLTSVSSEVRDQIQVDLDDIQQSHSAANPTVTAQAYLKYFADHPYDSAEGGLFLDAVQHIFLLPFSLQESYTQELVNKYCDLESEN